MLAGCSARPPQTEAPVGAESPTLSLTRWSSRTELFIEYPPLVQGESAAFAVHLTDIRSFRPLGEGTVILELEKDGKLTRFECKGPSRPGIFRVDARPGGGRGDPRCRPQGARLKEQQWSSDFATEIAVPRKIRQSSQVPATIRPRGGGEGSVISPVLGRLLSSPRPPVPGQHVKQGEVVASVVPFTPTPQDLAGLRLELSQAETDLAQAERQRIRLERLLEERAVPARRVEEIKADEARARARVEAARARLAQFDRTRSGSLLAEDLRAISFELRAPLGGVVTSFSAVAGGTAEAGQEIFHILAVDRVWVIAQIPEADSALLSGLKEAELEIPGTANAIPIPGPRANIERIGRIVDPESRRIPVIFGVANHDGLLRIGQSLFVRLGVGEAAERVSVPVSAVVDGGGRPVVFVQVAGESFQRRAVRTGPTERDYVQILEGIQPGERVVSKGAYSIRLAALSTQIPAHGHVH